MGGQVEPRVGFRARVKKFSNFVSSRSPKKGREDGTLSVDTDNLSNDSSFNSITAEINSITAESPLGLYHVGHEKGNPDFASLERQDSAGSRLGKGNVDGAASPWPEEFVCPISKSLMADPVIVESGVTYERQNVLAYLKTGNTNCFKTGDPLEHLNVTKNSALKKAIHNWCDSHQVPGPVAPDAETARWTVDRICGLDSTRTTGTLSTALSELHVSSDTASSSDSSGGGSRSLGVESLKASRSSAPEMAMPRSSANRLRPKLVSETVEVSPMDSSSSDLSHSAEWQYSGDRLYERQNHSWSGDKPRLFPEAHNSNGKAAADEERYWSSASALYAHSSSVVNSPTAPSSSAGAHHGRDGGVPLPLTTTPSAFSEQRGGSGPLPSNVGDLNDGLVSEFIRKLQHKQPLEQEQAVIEIRRLTRVSAQNRVTLCELELVEVLLALVQSRYSNVQINAVAAIMNMSLEKENKLKVARAGALPCLIDVLKSGHFEAQEHAAGAIFSLALNDENKLAIGVLGAIPPLIHLLRSGKHGARRDAAMALYHLSFAQMNRNKLIKAGGVAILLGIAKDEKSDVVSRALLILCNIAAMQEGRVALAEINAVPVMVGLLTRGDETGAARTAAAQEGEADSKVNWAEVREHAAATLLQLSHHNFRFKSQALQAGALDGLQRLAVEGTPRAREKAAALLTILRDAPNADNSTEDNGSLYRRSYLRNARGCVDDKAESAQF
ncbi:unnamed protein product [Calypogeia fissa]